MMAEGPRPESHQGEPVLHYQVQGVGPHVVMLHPVGLDLTCFDEVAAALSASFRVLRIDLRGHGRSKLLRPTHRLEDYAEDVHRLLQHLDFAPAGIVGFSFGGMVAQVLALEHPEDARALVIAACASTLPEDTRQMLADRGTQARRHGMGAVLEATLTRWFSNGFRARGGDQPVREALLAADPDTWAEAWQAMSAVHTAPWLREIQVPTLCLAGEGDISAPPHTIQEIAQSITGARFQVVSGAPHMLFIEQPAVISRILADFLANALPARLPADGSQSCNIDKN